MTLLPAARKKIKAQLARYERTLRQEYARYQSIHDGASKRYLLGALYLQLGDVAGALQSFAWFEQMFPADIGEPGQLLCWALTLYLAGCGAGEQVAGLPGAPQSLTDNRVFAILVNTLLFTKDLSMKFIDRQRELALLQTFLHQPTAGLLVLYGRRRVGKTSLLSHWLERAVQTHAVPATRALFWTATTQGGAVQRRDFSQALLRLDPRLATPPAADYALPSWEAAFHYVADLAAGAPTQLFVVVLDEFTYLVQSEPAIVSLLQRVWDHRLAALPNLRLVLSGSLSGIMEQRVLSGQSPLYGRATTLLRLQPLAFGALREIFPHWTLAERVAAYAVGGGIPSYLAALAQAANFSRALQAQVLRPESVFLSDAALLLNERLSDPYVYTSVLAAVASSAHTWNEIAHFAGLNEKNLGHYLTTLQTLGFVERRDPVLAALGGRHGRYHVADPFLRFYYRCLVPQRTAIERGNLAGVTATIRADLRAFIGTYTFEELCREWVRVTAERDELGFLPEQVGAYWSQKRGVAVQLDIVAASRRAQRLWIGEAKWGAAPVGRDVVQDLVARSQRWALVAEGWRVQYGVFARVGFTPAAQAWAQEHEMTLVTLADIEAQLVSAI